MGERTPLAVARRAGVGPDGGRRGDHQPARRADRARARQAELQLDGRVQRRSGRARRRRRALRHRAARSAMELCPALGIGVPVGKDSLSMRTRWRDDDGEREAGDGAGEPRRHRVRDRSTTCARRSTPQLAARRHDAGPGRPRRAAACAWAARCSRRCTGQFGDEVPDLDDPAAAQGAGRRRSTRCAPPACVLAYHDRSDGGLWAAVCEMAFAGHLGVSLNVDLLVTESDGIADSRAEYGDSKNWAHAGRARGARS